MARRGEALREHILWIAKDVFLEMGFERTSMDVIAARAETSKRTVYAHFESKEKLYLAVIELVRGLFLGRLNTPADYSHDSTEALIAFCGRFLEAVLYLHTVEMCRVSIAEAARFPEGAARYFDVLFTATQDRLAAYLGTTFSLSTEASAEAAEELIGRIIHPRFTRALFGMDKLADDFEIDIRADFDLTPIRKAVAVVVARVSNR